MQRAVAALELPVEALLMCHPVSAARFDREREEEKSGSVGHRRLVAGVYYLLLPLLLLWLRVGK